MADLQNALLKRLKAAPAVKAFVQYTEGGVAKQRIAWSTAAQGWALPYITLRVISEVWEEHLQGVNGQADTRVRIEVAASSYGQAVALTRAAVQVLAGAYSQDGINMVGRPDLITDRPTELSTGGVIEGKIADVLVRHNLA